MRRLEKRTWLIVTDEANTLAGFVTAATPEDAIIEWVGEGYDRAKVFLAPAEHVLTFEPHPKTSWRRN